MAIDPIRDGLNWYAYAENNPVMFVDPLGLANFNVALTDSGIGSPIDNIIAGINASMTYSKPRLAYDVNDEKTYYNSLEYMLFHSSQSDLERFYNTYYNPNQLHNPYTDLFFLTDETSHLSYDQRMTALQYFNKYGGCMKRWEEETGMSKNDGLNAQYAYIASSSLKNSANWQMEMAVYSTLESYSRIQLYKSITPYQPPVDSKYNKYDSSVDTKSKAGTENGKIPWDSWKNYEKITVNGQEYAKVGDRLYSKHAVDRMQPSGNRFGPNVYQAGGVEGRGVAPQFVEDVISSAKPVFQAGTGNYEYTSGTVTVIINPEGAVVTIMTK